MLRGYRSVIAASLVGLTAISIGLGFYAASLNSPKEQRYQAYGNSAGNNPGAPLPVSDIANTPMKRTPCERPNTESESDLCAQWRAAKAAENGADWTKWGVIFSVIGIIGLYWQIALTKEAVADTGKATQAMERQIDIAIMAQRGWVFVEEVKILHHPDGSIIRVTFKNYGQHPAPAFASEIVARNLPYPFWAIPLRKTTHDFTIMNLAQGQTHTREVWDFKITDRGGQRTRISISWSYRLPDNTTFNGYEDWLVIEDEGIFGARRMLPIDSINHPQNADHKS